MKKFGLTTVVVMVSACSAFSQTEKGTFMVGGSMSFGTRTYDGPPDTSTSYNMSLNPTGAYFFFDRFAAGIITGYSVSKTTNSLGPETRAHGYTIGANTRYYFPIAPKWALFPHLEYTYTKQYSKTTDATVGYETTGETSLSYLKPGLGITYFLARNVGVEGLLYTTPAPHETTFNLRISLQVYINKSGAIGQ